LAQAGRDPRRNGRRYRGLDVVAFEEVDESPVVEDAAARSRQAGTRCIMKSCECLPTYEPGGEFLSIEPLDSKAGQERLVFIVAAEMKLTLWPPCSIRDGSPRAALRPVDHLREQFLEPTHIRL
jgi:hypothetical protein